MMSALKWRIALGLVLVFAAGVATGLFAGAWHSRHRFLVRHGEMGGDRLRDHFRRQLDLTPEQAGQVDPILEETAKRLHEVRTETSQRVAQIMEQSHRELAPHLTPEQQARIERMKQRHLRILHRHGGHERPPPPGP